MMQSAPPVMIISGVLTISKSIQYGAPEKQQKQRAKKPDFDFWGIPKDAAAFWHGCECLEC